MEINAISKNVKLENFKLVKDLVIFILTLYTFLQTIAECSWVHVQLIKEYVNFADNIPNKTWEGGRGGLVAQSAKKDYIFLLQKTICYRTQKNFFFKSLGKHEFSQIELPALK